MARTLDDLVREALNDPEARMAYLSQDALNRAHELLVEMRRNAKLTQTDIARRMGVPQSQIARLERRTKGLTWRSITAYCEACGYVPRLVVVPEQVAVEEARQSLR